jgi:hexosaminidase
MQQTINIIPRPHSISMGNSKLTLTRETKITCQGEGAFMVGELLSEYLQPVTGLAIPVSSTSRQGIIHLKADEIGIQDEAGFVDESYQLSVKASGVVISAQNAAGLSRGIQTLRQLLPVEIFADTYQNIDWELPEVEILDAPRFCWRGVHLDVSRHFFTVAEVCKFIDLLALHRLNLCHLHLTDDQGWRVEIKKYPRLTEVGSKRSETLVGHMKDRPRTYDNTPHEGFYSQEDITQIIEFASRRHITIVPEIDMPGHMVAAITCYPELGNFIQETEVRCYWGISQSVLNVEEATVSFMKDVLSEVMDLFPSRFIHIGGDEAPKYEWSQSKRAQTRMAELGLKSEDELQSWFIKQMNRHITNSGRYMIGWDEILEGGLAEGAAVMSWRGEAGGIEAANNGHRVVMAPYETTYFDYYQAEPIDNEPLAIGGLTTLDMVYGYEPIPEAVLKENRHLVLGGQGQLWSEYMPDMKQVEYMGFPRICALSEVLWLQSEQKCYTEFLERLKTHRERLHNLGVEAHGGMTPPLGNLL